MSIAQSTPSAVDRVVCQLRDDILGGRYRAEDRLPSERELSEKLGVNRGAVREGLRTLAQLGIVEVGPGGAKACGIQQASLDIVSHLLDSDEVPDVALVDQVMEVHAHLFSSCVRLGVLRGSNAQLARAREQLAALQDESLGPIAHFDQVHEFVSTLFEASGNLVLQLIHRALALQFWQRLEASGEIPPPRLPRSVLTPLARGLDEALAERDPQAAQDCFFSLVSAHREQAVRHLSSEQARNLRSQLSDHIGQLFRSAESTSAPTGKPR
ncbi:MAG: GntR family transcriptional regulator [Myxococcota bacterium]